MKQAALKQQRKENSKQATASQRQFILDSLQNSSNFNLDNIQQKNEGLAKIKKKMFIQKNDINSLLYHLSAYNQRYTTPRNGSATTKTLGKRKQPFGMSKTALLTLKNAFSDPTTANAILQRAVQLKKLKVKKEMNKLEKKLQKYTRFEDPGRSDVSQYIIALTRSLEDKKFKPPNYRVLLSEGIGKIKNTFIKQLQDTLPSLSVNLQLEFRLHIEEIKLRYSKFKTSMLKLDMKAALAHLQALHLLMALPKLKYPKGNLHELHKLLKLDQLTQNEIKELRDFMKKPFSRRIGTKMVMNALNVTTPQTTSATQLIKIAQTQVHNKKSNK